MGIVFSLLIAMMGTIAQGPIASDADDILGQLSKIRIDKTQIYHVRDLTIRRDVLTIALNRGVIAFLEPVQEKSRAEFSSAVAKSSPFLPTQSRSSRYTSSRERQF